KANAVDALFQEADALSTVNEVALFQVWGNTGPDSLRRPVRIMPWSADQFAVWLDPEDCTQPGAIPTIDFFDQKRRLRLWTPDALWTYYTDKLRWPDYYGGRQFKLDKKEKNRYGILPFSSVHFRFPATAFWTGSPGDTLRYLNAHLNYRMSDLADW